MDKINLVDKLSQFSEHWKPKVIAELNGQQVRICKFQGEFHWHKHADEDELFFVIKGTFDMQYRNRTVKMNEGELVVVARGVEHCPKAEQEVHVMLFEPSDTLNTGNIRTERTVDKPEQL